MKTLPYIENGTFYLEGKPHLLRAVETANSASSNAFSMEQVWPGLEGLHVNTVLFPITWESVEPEEGVYDFSNVKALIEQCRQHEVKAVFLWFGLWKNAESHYVPGWVKRDSERFWLAEDPYGKKLMIVSPLCEEAVKRDKAAFEHLLAYLREEDAEKQTVIMLQVENEIGIMPCNRDYSAEATRKFMQEIPAEVADICGKNGSWKDVFGRDAQETFMAYHYAKAVNEIAAAGKEAYALPMYVNAWLEQFPWEAGTYPSGGPQAKMHWVWKAFAPAFDMFAPDIYVPYITDVCDEYRRNENPLFVPECRPDARSVTSMLYGMLGQDAFGWAFFRGECMKQLQGIRDKADFYQTMNLDPGMMAELNIDMSAFDMRGSYDLVSEAYAFVEEVEPLYFANQGTGKWHAFIKRNEFQLGETVELANARVRLRYQKDKEVEPASGGVIVELDEHRFLICGYRCQIELLPPVDSGKQIDIVKLCPATVKGGKVLEGPIMNGDERGYLGLGEGLTCFVIDTYLY